MELGVISATYVGLVTAVGLSELGHDVTCTDDDPARVRRLQAGDAGVGEPELGPALRAGLAAGCLRFSTDPADGIRGRAVIFVASAVRAHEEGVDLSGVLLAADRVRALADRPVVLVLSSAVPVGTHERVRLALRESRYTIQVVSQPENLPRGAALRAFREQRIVIGAHDRESLAPVLRQVYATERAADRMVWTDPASAELTRHLANGCACRPLSA